MSESFISYFDNFHMGKLSCPARESKNYKEKENFTGKKKTKQQQQQVFQKTKGFVFLTCRTP